VAQLEVPRRAGRAGESAVRIFPPGAETIDTSAPPAVTIGDGGSAEMSRDLQDLSLVQFGVYEFEILVHGQPALVTSLEVIRRSLQQLSILLIHAGWRPRKR
jgi:hypothetical protein